LGIGAFTQVKERPVILFALLWWGLCLAPSSSVVALKETFAEHRSYLALMGPALGLAWAVGSWEKQAGRWVTLCLCLVLMGTTHLRNRVWSSEASLWQDAVDKNPESAEAWYALGDARRLAKDPQGARKAYKRAVRLRPEYSQAWNNLGLLEIGLGGWDAAEAAWKQALIQNPSYCPAHNNLGKLYGEQGRYQLAAVELNTTLSKCPRDCTAHRLLGEVYQYRLRDKRLAVMHYEAYLEICPSQLWSPEIRERLTRLTW
jgi:tetratricopeptide (TPR) repeat protein